MSQLVAVCQPSSGREIIERAARLRRSFFPRRFAPRPVTQGIKVCIVDAAPVEIPLPPQMDMQREIAEIVAAAGKRIRVVDILCAVGDHFAIRKIDLLSHRRTRNLCRPRQIVMFLSKDLTTRSLPEIGRLLGGKDHTTVLHGVRKITALIAAGDAITADVDAIRARLLA